MEFYPGGLVLFSLVLELGSSSFRSTKVFRIITIKDPNLEDLFLTTLPYYGPRKMANFAAFQRPVIFLIII